MAKGRKLKIDPLRVAGWRQTRNASIAQTAAHFGICRKTVTNYCRDYGEAAREARLRWKWENEVEAMKRLDREIEFYMPNTKMWRKLALGSE